MIGEIEEVIRKWLQEEIPSEFVDLCRTQQLSHMLLNMGYILADERFISTYFDLSLPKIDSFLHWFKRTENARIKIIYSQHRDVFYIVTIHYDLDLNYKPTWWFSVKPFTPNELLELISNTEIMKQAYINKLGKIVAQMLEK
jgi:hypothetical protein